MVKKKKNRDRSYLRWTNESLFNTEVESINGKIAKFGYRFLTTLCDNLNLDEVAVNKEIRKAIKDGQNSCEYEKWRFSWMNVDQWRDWVITQDPNIILNVRVGRVHGLIPKSIDEFPTGQKEFGKLMIKFMAK